MSDDFSNLDAADLTKVRGVTVNDVSSSDSIINWLKETINTGPDFAGRTLLRSYNRRFGASSQELPVAALPGLMPGQVNISGADGGKTWHEFSYKGSALWFYVKEIENNDCIGYAVVYANGSFSKIRIGSIGSDQRYYRGWNIAAHASGVAAVVNMYGPYETDTANCFISTDFGSTWSEKFEIPGTSSTATVAISQDGKEVIVCVNRGDYVVSYEVGRGNLTTVFSSTVQPDGAFSAFSEIGSFHWPLSQYQSIQLGIGGGIDSSVALNNGEYLVTGQSFWGFESHSLEWAQGIMGNGAEVWFTDLPTQHGTSDSCTAIAATTRTQIFAGLYRMDTATAATVYINKNNAQVYSGSMEDVTAYGGQTRTHTDGYDNWVVLFGDGRYGKTTILISTDDGSTWEEIVLASDVLNFMFAHVDICILDGEVYLYGYSDSKQRLLTFPLDKDINGDRPVIDITDTETATMNSPLINLIDITFGQAQITAFI